MNKAGKFIVIDGSDGSGKQTQADILIKRLKKLGKKVKYFDFPQYEKSFFGKMVGRYLNGEFGEISDTNPYLISILYAGDRFEASSKIKNALEEGCIVVSNRYIQSNMGFQTAKMKSEKQKDEFLKWLEKMEYSIFNIPKADRVIYLHVPSRISQKLVDHKAKRNYTDKKRDLHEANLKFLKSVEKQYLDLSVRYKEWEKVECVEYGQIMTPEKISDLVFEVIKPMID